MSRKIYIRNFLIAAIILLASSFYYLPYYVSKPGMAKELEPIIEVDGGYDEEGSLMLTTVRMGRANIYSYILAKLSKYQEIFPAEMIKYEHETDEEYALRQLRAMDTSKLSAIEVAYKKAGIPVEYRYKGVYVMSVLPDMPAEGKLKPGDRIFKINDVMFKSSDEFKQYVSKKKKGDMIQISYVRNGKANRTMLQVMPFPDNRDQLGIGIVLEDDKEIIVEPDVKVNTDEIGGPSAGLMFALEIYNQLTEDDLTQGFDIAGTGTISPDGTVGRIGGIEQKIVAADKAGADIFLAPNEKGAHGSNYEIAVKTATDIGTDMKIVPVDTFDDAVFYLENLKEKK
ncbi:PDZ domain-containing protein [Bacillus methanolicus PB1]|uniref:endopeptidase La n=1 Tax=Bacillus methanolicus PB1 TaxID=997296 RepID=I3E542_BACMT|nr:SepM family pheromone-processing serine protease [Bacillus methanolicus]EIJ81613.1 PDZ domain-containing protein [Bacillus methanolicus PB1]